MIYVRNVQQRSDVLFSGFATRVSAAAIGGGSYLLFNERTILALRITCLCRCAGVQNTDAKSIRCFVAQIHIWCFPVGAAGGTPASAGLNAEPTQVYVCIFDHSFPQKQR